MAQVSRGQHACPALLEANGHTPAVRPALEQQDVTTLFLQRNTRSFEERHFIWGGVSHDTQL